MSETVVEGIVPADSLQQFVDAFLPIVSEAKIHFDEDGLHASAVDPANVAMVSDAHLDAAAFEAYEAPGRCTVGANLEAIDDRLGVADSDDLVNFSVDMETRHLHVGIRNIDQQVALIDPDQIRKEPPDNELELSNEVVVEGAVLDEAVTVAEIVSDHIGIAAEPDNERVVVTAEGDVDASEVEWGHDEVVDAKVRKEGASLFSLEYVNSLAKPIPSDAEVTIWFDDEFPTEWTWEAVEGDLTVRQRLAPRIKTR